MHHRVIPLGLLLSATAVAALAAPASGAAQLRPRAGMYAGQEVVGADLLNVSFSVPKTRTRLTGFDGDAVAKAGCNYYITAFSWPKTPIKVKKSGRFAATSTNYPPPAKGRNKVTVAVTGAFTSPTAAHGRISVKITRIKGCNASRTFTASRTS